MTYSGNLRLHPGGTFLHDEMEAIRDDPSLQWDGAALRMRAHLLGHKHRAVEKMAKAAPLNDMIGAVNMMTVWPIALSVWHGLEETINIIEREAYGTYQRPDRKRGEDHHDIRRQWGRLPERFKSAARKVAAEVLSFLPFPSYVSYPDLDAYLSDCDHASCMAWRYNVREGAIYEGGMLSTADGTKFMHHRLLLEVWGALIGCLSAASGARRDWASHADHLFWDVDHLFQEVQMPYTETNDWVQEIGSAIGKEGSVLQLILKHMDRKVVVQHPHNVLYLDTLADAMRRTTVPRSAFSEDWRLLVTAADRGAIEWTGAGWSIDQRKLECTHPIVKDRYCGGCERIVED